MNYKTIAETYLGGLQDGFLFPNQITSWAASEIQKRSRPDDILIQLAVADDDESKIVRLLSEIQGLSNDEESLRLRLGFLAIAFNEHPEWIEGIPPSLFSIAQDYDDNPMLEGIISEMYDLFNDWEFDEPAEIMREKLQLFFSKYAKRMES